MHVPRSDRKTGRLQRECREVNAELLFGKYNNNASTRGNRVHGLHTTSLLNVTIRACPVSGQDTVIATKEAGHASDISNHTLAFSELPGGQYVK